MCNSGIRKHGELSQDLGTYVVNLIQEYTGKFRVYLDTSFFSQNVALEIV